MTALNMGQLSDQIFDLQAQIDKIEAQAKAKSDPLKKQAQGLEEQLKAAMQDAGLSEITGKKSSTKITTKLRVGFKDFEAFATWLYRKKAAHLFERRIGVVAYREMKELMGGKPIPGLSEFEQDTLKVTKA